MAENIEKPFIIAHRGASADAPENTLAAFQKAIYEGAEGIELDVQFAKDGVSVVFHDFRLERITNKKGRVSDFTSRELQNLNAGKWFNVKNPNKADPSFTKESIPTLAQVLEFLADFKGLIFLEMKCRPAEVRNLAESIYKTISGSKLLPLLIVKSFNLDAIYFIKELIPEVRTAALFAPKIRTILQDKSILLEKAEKHRADELSIHCSMATEKFVQKAAAKGFPITIWTANNCVWVKRAFDLGINAIITNNPAKLLNEKQKISAQNKAAVEN